MGMFFKMLMKGTGPKLLPSQEIRSEAAKRIGIRDADYEAAKGLLGFPSGQNLVYSDSYAGNPRTVRVVMKKDVDEWRDALLKVARTLR